ncbi:MAG TPA: 2-oxoacid:acceptor oxidoreductase family protein, partial [Casimicrobiaceae bacterium]
FEPFMIGHSITGYGMGLSSAAGVAPISDARPLATVGDGGFWHNGFLSGVTSAVKNGTDSVLLIFKNGYTSATGTQELVSTPKAARRDDAGGQSTTATDTTIENVLEGVGVPWLRTVHSYDVATMRSTLEEAFTTKAPGLKVVVAEGECQLERQRRLRARRAQAESAERRNVRVRYGIDEDVCSGDRACIRLSGCPSLTLTTPADPLRDTQVTTIDSGCVGCGLCGELAQTAALCPSFHRVEVVTQPTAFERFVASIRALALRTLLANSMTSPSRPRLLVAALGGQGGGVLTDWIVSAARAEGYVAQATSTPGVSQRTGATTYYVEIAAQPVSGEVQVLGLSPVAGRVDVLVCAELLEAARMLERGFCTPLRTTVVASTHRVYTTREKMSAGDGRYDADRIERALRELSARAVLFDMEALRKRHDTAISATLFGALAGSGALPVSRQTCEQAIGAAGKGVVASVRAFADAYEQAQRSTDRPATSPARATGSESDVAVELRMPAELASRVARWPAGVAELARLGVAELGEYQDRRYAAIYVDRVERI